MAGRDLLAGKKIEQARNALVAMTVEEPAFWDLVLSAYARIPAASPAS